MHYETIQTQMKIAQLLHDIGCADKPTTHLPDERQKCLDWPGYVVQSAGFLGKLMPTIVMELMPQVRKDEREKTAYHIRAEQGSARDPRPSASACIVSGGTEPCKPNYFCPTVGEVESPCHGGFDVCCRRPELHREKK